MDSIIINKGECLHVTLDWDNEDGTPINITGRTFTVFEAAPLFTAVFTVTDAVNGKVEMQVTDTSMLNLGRSNRFRISMSVDGGCVDTTPPIWIDVK